MKDLFLDFESFFGSVVVPGEFVGKRNPKPKKMSLSLSNPKLSYTDYVRHPEFEVLGMSVRWEDEPAPRFIRGPECRAWLEKVDWKNTRVIAHNAVFDGLILFEIFNIVPAAYFCTMAAAEAIYQGAVAVGLDVLARLFGVGSKSPDLKDFRDKHCRDLSEPDWEKLARYANNDINLLVGIFQMLRSGLPPEEIELMSNTIMLFCDPVMIIDEVMAQEALDDAIRERDTLVAATGKTLEQISGDKSFEEALRARLGWIPTKFNDKDEIKPAFAKTDLEFVALRSHADPIVRALVEARLEVGSSLNITRAQRLLTLATTGSRMANICLHYGRAHTLRWTGGNKMNPQNFTRGSKLRLSLRAPEGKVLVVVDSSQIEARVLAALAGQTDLVDMFRRNLDPYSRMASRVFGFEVNKKDHPTERFVGKVMVLALGYGMGWRKFYNNLRTGASGMALDVTEDFARNAVNVYRGSNDKIMALHVTAESWLGYLCDDTQPKKAVLGGLLTLDPATKRVIFPNGCYLRYPELCNDEGQYQYKSWDHKKNAYVWKKIYGGLFVENIVQALARHIVAWQILQISRVHRCVLFVHDECVYCVPREIADEALAFGQRMFKTMPPWLDGLLDVPLDSEGGYDVAYSK